MRTFLGIISDGQKHNFRKEVSVLFNQSVVVELFLSFSAPVSNVPKTSAHRATLPLRLEYNLCPATGSDGYAVFLRLKNLSAHFYAQRDYFSCFFRF